MNQAIANGELSTLDWRSVRLGDVVGTFAGGTPSRGSRGLFGGNIPWVKSSELNLPRISATDETLTNEGFAASSAKWVEAGTPLIALYGATAGVVGWLDIRACTNQAVLALVPRNCEVVRRWLYWLLRFRSRDLTSTVQGSGQPNLSKGIVEGLRFTLPSPDEQTRIAAVLDTVDEAIAKTEGVIAKLKQVRAGLLHDLLTRGLDDHGQLRDPLTHPEQFHELPLGTIPRAWDVKALRQLLEFISYGFTNPMPTTAEGPWMITAVDIGDGQINFEDARHTSQMAFDSLLTPKSRPRLGDILVTKDGTLGRVAVVDRDQTCINQSVAVLHPLPSTHTAFVSLYLRSPMGQKAMLADVGGSTIKHIYISKLAEMLIPIPPEPERTEIVRMVDQAAKLVETDVDSLTKLQLLKSGLMTDLLTGRVPVPEEIVRAEP